MRDLVQLFPCLKATFQAWRREASSEVHTSLLPLPKGIVAEEPDWAAFLFVKTRWESSVFPATLDPVIWSVGNVVVNELAHLHNQHSVVCVSSVAASTEGVADGSG